MVLLLAKKVKAAFSKVKEKVTALDKDNIFSINMGVGMFYQEVIVIIINIILCYELQRVCT